MSDRRIRYVAPDGNDDNGTSPDAPMGSVAAAVQSLPTFGSGGQQRHSGLVRCYAGTITETETIEYNAALTIEGIGAGSSPDEGSVIQRGHDGSLFAPSEAFTDWSHHLVMRNLALDGNKANFPAVADLVQIKKPGFNTVFRDVFFRKIPRYAVDIQTAAIDCYFYNVSGAGCEGGFLHYAIPASTNMTNIGVWGGQFDNCGPDVFYIEDGSTGDANVVILQAIKTETNNGSHDSVVRVHTTGGSNPLFVTIDGVSAWRSDGLGDAVIKRTHTGGTTPRFSLRNIHGSGYNLAFHDAQTGIQSRMGSDNHIFNALYSDGSRGVQIGDSVVLSGSGSPNNALSAPVGALYMRVDGGANNSLYVKESGTGKTGWVPK